MVINLNLTQGGGFYLLKNHESVTSDRRIVLRDLQTGEFLDDFSHGKGPAKGGLVALFVLPTAKKCTYSV